MSGDEREHSGRSPAGKGVDRPRFGTGASGHVFDRRKTGFYVPLAEALADDAATLSHGARSRRLALQVLGAQGVELPWPVLAAQVERANHDGYRP